MPKWAYPAKRAKKKSRKIRKVPLEMQRLFSQLQLSNQRAVSTSHLTERGFDWKTSDAQVQHDVHELITLLLDLIDREFKKTDNSKMVTNMFEGVQRAQLKCMACNHVSGPPKEPFRTLLVQVKGHPNMAHTLAKDVFWSETRSQLDCDECNKKQDKQFVLVCHKLPPLLWVSMSRFDIDYTTNPISRKKIKDRFEFPLLLDLAPYVSSDAAPDHPFDPTFAMASTNPNPAAADRSVSLADGWRDVVDTVFNLRKGNGDRPLGAHEGKGGALHQGGGGDGTGDERLLYDLVGIVLHSGSGYSGHYISLIRDQALESNWKADDIASADSAVVSHGMRRGALTKPTATATTGTRYHDHSWPPPSTAGAVRRRPTTGTLVLPTTAVSSRHPSHHFHSY
mmetsp:Transcript_108374/g.315095  ORF Transcript_108374/g.315095 Transcript_108374/m.315095 type:complete len:395 (+) Transcript_108374:678-1862(+)